MPFAPCVDLHSHSTASDGTLTPTELVNAAQRVGLAGLALTDHDTGNGLLEAQTEAARIGLRFVPGIEITAEFRPPVAMDILGHFINPTSPALQQMSHLLIEARDSRNPKIIARLNELGCNITLEQAQTIAHKKIPAGQPFVLGRPHIAQALVDSGCVASVKQAFDVYLGSGGSAYFDKARLTPRQAIECIHNAGGLATLAHPVHLAMVNPTELQTLVAGLVDMGLDGIEVWHADHRPQDCQLFLSIAHRYNLAVTGGSDFHGRNKPDVALGLGKGNVAVPVAVLNDLEERWHQRSGTLAAPASPQPGEPL
ncbi:MAG: PHP domain-containing protein [Phycisphaerae bacterium]|nr:PHP domain-containing protein [Phycisphaerae bacterium]